MNLPLYTTPSPASHAPADCPYETLIVDLTHRCNMACHNCYVPNRHIPDMDASWLEDILARLPPRRFVRLAGGEPTLREDLPAIIRAVRRHRHHPILLTNGLKLAEPHYLDELRAAGLGIVYLSMNGGGDDALYLAVDNMRCAERKRMAFDALQAGHVFTSIGMIAVRGLNESAIGVMWSSIKSLRHVRELKIRSVGAIGRYQERRPFSLAELAGLFTEASGIDPATCRIRERTSTAVEFWVGRQRIQLTQWPDFSSPTRGRLTPEGRIAPFFEHVIANEGGY